MINIAEVQLMPLKSWVELIENDIPTLPSRSEEAETMKYINRLIVDIKDGLLEREQSILFASDILSSDTDETGTKLILNKKEYEILLMRKQILLSILSITGGVYDSCSRLGHVLSNGESPPEITYFRDIFFKNTNNLVNKSAPRIVGKIKQEYDYPLAAILFFRNCFVHRGEFFFENGIFKDIVPGEYAAINEDVVLEMERYIKKMYNLEKYTKAHFDLDQFSGKSIFDAIQLAMKYADQSIGMLLNSLYLQQKGLLFPE